MTYAGKIAKQQATRWQPGGGMETWDAFDILQRALSVRRLERVKTRMRQTCQYQEPERHEVGDAGEPPCYLDDRETREWCGDCLARKAELETLRPLLNRAKRRLRAALDRRIEADR